MRRSFVICHKNFPQFGDRYNILNLGVYCALLYMMLSSNTIVAHLTNGAESGALLGLYDQYPDLYPDSLLPISPIPTALTYVCP